jgi:hypothetical protein
MAIPRYEPVVTSFLTHLNKVIPSKRDQKILLSYMAACVQNKGSKFQWQIAIIDGPLCCKNFFDACLLRILGAQHINYILSKNNSGKVLDSNGRQFYTIYMNQDSDTGFKLDGQYYDELYEILNKEGCTFISEYLSTFNIPDEFNPMGPSFTPLVTGPVSNTENEYKHYQRVIKTVTAASGEKIPVVVDIYDVLNVFKTDCPALDHAAKKILVPGGRGAKDVETDKKEAIASIKRSIDMNKGDV